MPVLSLGKRCVPPDANSDQSYWTQPKIRRFRCHAILAHSHGDVYGKLTILFCILGFLVLLGISTDYLHCSMFPILFYWDAGAGLYWIFILSLRRLDVLFSCNLCTTELWKSYWHLSSWKVKWTSRRWSNFCYNIMVLITLPATQDIPFSPQYSAG